MTTTITGSKDLLVQCDAYRRDRSCNNVTLLSFYGETTMVRGMAAHAQMYGSLNIENYTSFTRLAKDASYSVLSQSIGEGLSHTVIIDRRATNVASSWDKTLFVVADNLDEAKANWVGRFGRRCRVPIRASWGPDLWDLGVENRLIDTCEGFGLGMWYVSLDHEKWQQVISEAVLDGVFDGKT